MVTVIVLAVLAAITGVLFFLSSRARPELLLGKVLVYAVAFIGTFVLYAVLAIVGKLSPSLLFWLIFGLSLIAGIIHTWLLHRRFAWVQKELFLAELLLTLFMYATGTLLLCLLCTALADYASVSFLAGAATAFLLPFFIHKSFLLWQAVPPPYFYKWFFPTEKEVPTLTFQNTIPLQFTFEKEINHTDSTTFAVVAPNDIQLGDLFHSFLEEYNQHNTDSPIQSYRPPFSWIFYCETHQWWKPLKVVDPNASVAENNLKPNDLVNAVRIRK
ncbi:TssN family type VI secretion system protein [Tunicatimonas pelagia]|uniref:TssN family type VI secretion system protein n=1 Tax=Tunicatimonas pelagia TaxID=931531 RepID=UPI002666CF20|nr:TssN family type VI secretion system protein [Tunicatimonas pelagia]WKN41291.1 TssN family type VI secretion system protein [Tunicatimonas pelagia]